MRNGGYRLTVTPVVRRIVLTILTLAVLLPTAAFAGARYLCAFDGEVRASCCCPSKAQKEKRDVEPVSEIRGNCCCTVSVTSLSDAPQIQIETARGIIDAPVAFTALAFALPAPKRVLPAHAIETRPPKLDRSLFVRHCALLL